MKVLIIDQCSGSKEFPDDLRTVTQEEIDAASLNELLKRSDVAGIPANELYSGRQQRRISEAVAILRSKNHEVDRWFVSAGFGLVSGREELPPYEVTFTGMNIRAIDQRAKTLEIPRDVSRVIKYSQGTPYDVIFFALGADYYRAVDLENILRQIPQSTIGVLFNQEDNKSENILSVSARTTDAKRHNTIVVALKGVYIKNFAQQAGPETTPSETAEIQQWCQTTGSAQSEFGDFA